MLSTRSRSRSERGSVLGLIGPNGSGKTTLMNVISGVYKPNHGAVFFGGKRIADVPTYAVCQLGIARTFQVVKPFANLTVRENVAVGAMYGRNGGKRGARASFERAQELLEIVGLSRVAGRFASELTVPNRKRLEVAKALALDPEVLLLDEVMAGLNATEVDEALRLLRTVNEARRDVDRRRALDESDRLDLDHDRRAGGRDEDRRRRAG